ncbi:hypothetical protein N2152v2_008938 [Parachlorella kessleri]
MHWSARHRPKDLPPARRYSQPQGASSRPWIQAANPLQQLAAAKAPAASQPNMLSGPFPRPAPTTGTSRPLPGRFQFSQPQTSSQNFSQPQEQPAADMAEYDHHDYVGPSQENSMRPTNTAARLLNDIQQKQTFMEAGSQQLVDRVSNKIESITVKQDALDGRLDGFSAELRGQGGKLSSLEATLMQVQEVLSKVQGGTEDLSKQVQHALAQQRQRRPVLTEIGVQTSFEARMLCSPGFTNSQPPRPTTLARASPAVKRSRASQQLIEEAPAPKATSQPLRQGGRTTKPTAAGKRSLAAQHLEEVPDKEAAKPTLQPRRVTRQSRAAHQAEQPARVEACAPQMPVRSFSRRRSQETLQESKPAATAAATSNAGLLFDSLFGDKEVMEQQQSAKRQCVGSDIAAIVQARMQRHRQKLMRNRSREE